MSNYVDERILEMRFDNKHFETNVAHTIKKLDKLKMALNFDGAGNGLSKLKQDVSDLGDTAEQTGKKTHTSLTQRITKLRQQFKLIDFVYLQTLNKWAQTARDTGTKIFHSLMLDDLWAMNTKNIQAGWSKYESKAASVQTIMNSTGLSINKVNGYLDKLMWYSDETSYSFADMTNALGTMLASGGDINKLIPMIEGMANATSYAGKGASEFNRVLYNLNQSYSQGFLSLQDWKSVQLAGVNSKALIDTLIDTGVALGKLKKGEVTASNFTASLSSKWADTEVMEEGFRKFAEATELAYDMVDRGEVSTASEAYERLSKSMTGVGITAAKAAQEAKSFGEAMTSVKDAVATKWMTVFEYVFGNYQQSKVTWTNLANGLWEIFAGPFDDIVEMSGFDVLTSGARAVGIDMDQLKSKLVELAIAEGTLTEADAMAGDLFGELADKSWITQKIYADAVESLGVTNKKNIDELKATWNEWQKLQYSEWVEKGGRALEDLQEWELNVLGTTKEQVAEYGIATNQFADYAQEIRDVNGEYSELIEHINDPGQYKMGYTEIIRKAFAESAIDDISESLDEAGMSLVDLEDSFKSVGIASGKVTEDMIKESGGLVESFTSGWLDRDTYVAALEDYAKKQTAAAEDIQAGMTDTQKYWYDRLVVEGGKTIDEMAQWELDAIGIGGRELIEYNERIKKIREYIDAVRTGEKITDKMFAGLVDRNGRMAIAGAIDNLVKAYASVRNTFGSIIEALFPVTDEQKIEFIRNIALGFEWLTSKLIISDNAIESLSDAVAWLGDGLQFVWSVSRAMLSPMTEFANSMLRDIGGELVAGLRIAGGYILDNIAAVRDWLQNEDNISAVTKALQVPLKSIHGIVMHIVNGFKTGNYSFSHLAESAVAFYQQLRDRLVGIVSIIDPNGYVSKVVGFLVKQFDKFKKTLADLGKLDFSGVDEFINGILNFDFKNSPLGKFSKWVGNITSSVSQFFIGAWKVAEWAFGAIRKLADSIISLISYFFGPDFVDRMFEGAIEVGRIVEKLFALKEISAIGGLITQLASVLKGLEAFKSITITFKAVSEGLIDIVKLFTGSINAVATGIKTVGIGVEILGFAALIYAVAKAFSLLEGFDIRKDYQAVVLLIGMLGLVLAMMTIINKITGKVKVLGDEDDSKNSKSTMMSVLGSLASILLISGAVLAMAYALKAIMSAIGDNPNELWPALRVIAATVFITSAAIGIIGTSFKNVDTKGLAAAFLMIPLTLAGLVFMVKIVSDYLDALAGGDSINQGKVVSLVIALVTVISAIGILVVILKKLDGNKISTGTAATLVSLAAVLYVVGIAVGKLASVFDKGWGAALFGVAVVMVTIIAILAMLSKFSGEAKISIKAAAAIVAFGAFLVILTGALAILSLMDTDKLLASAGAIFLVLIGLAGGLWAVSAITKNTKLTGIIGMLLVFGAVVGTLIAMELQIGSALTALGYGTALLVVLLGLGFAMAMVGSLTNKIRWAPIITTVLMFITIALGLGILEHYVKDIKKFAIIAALLTVTLVAAAGAMLIVSNITKALNIGSVLLTIGAMAAVAIALVAITMAFSKIGRVELKNVAPVLIALGVGLAALAAVSALLGLFPIGLAGVAGAILLLVGLDVTIYAIATAFDKFVGAIERLTPILPDLGANIEDMSKKIGDADLEAISQLFSTFAGSVDQYTGAFSSLKRLVDAGAFAIVANALGPLADALIGINPSLPSLGENIREFSKNLQGTDFKNLESLLTVSASPVRELVDIAGDAFLPLVGLAIAAKLVNGAITGLGEKLYNVALGVSGIRMALDFGGELGQTFANSILNVSPYAQVAVQAVGADTMKAVEGIDISAGKVALEKKGNELSSAFVASMDPAKTDKTWLEKVWYTFGQLLSGVFGVETGGEDPFDVMFGGPKGYEPIGDLWSDKTAAYFEQYNNKKFDYGDPEDWANVLGVDADVVKSMMELAAKEAEENSDTAYMTAIRYAFSDYDDPDLPETLVLGDRSIMINYLYKKYLKNAEKAAKDPKSAEPDAETETAIEHTAEVIAENAVEGLNEVNDKLEERVIEKLDEQIGENTTENNQKAVEDKVREMAEQLQPGALDEQTIKDIADKYNGSDSDLFNAVMSAVSERKQKKDGNLANKTGLFVRELLNGQFDPSLITPVVAEWTAENFGTKVPKELRESLEQYFGTTDATDILARVKGMTSEDWSEFVTKYFPVAVADFIPEGGMDEFLKPLLESLGLDQLDLQSLLGTFQGHFTDSLPADYFDGTAAKFTEAGNSSIDAFVAALQTDQGNIEKLQAAAVVLGETLTAPINEKLSENNMIEVGGKAIAALGSGIRSKESTVTTQAEHAKGAIVSALSGYSNTYQVGINYMLGIKKGLTDTENEVNDTIIQIGKDMVQKMYEAIHSNSPAKDTMPIGRYFMQGVQVGIMDEETNTFHTIDEVAASAVDHMAEAIMLANAVVSNAVDDQPTIKPLMDLSEIEYGAERMNNLLSTQAATRVQMGRETTVTDPSTNVQNGGSVINYTQNNYSPKSLSRIEIYRQTRNQLATLHK